MRIGQTSFVYFVSQVVGSAIGFVATVYFARELGAGVLGVYFLVLGVVAWLQIAGTMGVSGALAKRVSEGEARGRHLGAGLVLIAGLFVLVSIVLVLVRGPLGRYLSYSRVEFLVLLLGVGLLNAVVSSTLKGEHKVHVLAVLRPLGVGARALVQVGLVLAGAGLVGLFVGYAAGTAVVAIAGASMIATTPRRPGRRHVRSVLSFAQFSWLGSVRAQTFNWIDVVVLGVFVSSSLIGVYSVAWSVSAFLLLFGNAIATTVFPEISAISSREGDERVDHLITDALGYGGLILIPGLVGALVVGDRLLRIYGEAFVAGRTVLGLLVVACLLYGYQTQLVNALNAIDRPELAFRVNGAFIAVNLVANVVLIATIGWVGAAIATALSAGIGLLLAARALRSNIRFAVPVRRIVQQWFAAVAMGAVVLAVRWSIETFGLLSHNFATVVLLVTIGAVVYFGLLSLISASFRRVVLRNLPSRLIGED